jgi:tetratricopeptide (TPR) repeat protein/outer membrane biosynthesis protein TonB
MADAATGSERRFDATVYSPATSADPSSPDRAQRTGLRAIETGGEVYQEFTSLQKLGVQKQEMGSFAEAEDCFLKALQIGERMFGAEHPEMIILLNDLTRLYLKQGSYASAEPLLLRLLDLKKSKGEDHPEVATVLASLAAVRQALGRHESAEQLWRRVVDIRDRTLAPNHFATATALEHLGESCAARGKIRAALAAFERAQLIRERTLGAEHPSVRICRERIADLQLQDSEDSFYPDDDTEQLSKPPERFRLSSGERAATPPAQPILDDRLLQDAAPAKRPAVLVMPRPASAETQTADDAGDANSLSAMDAEPLQLSTVAPYRDALESVRRELEEPGVTPSLWSRGQTLVEPMTALLRRRDVAIGVAVSAVALVLLGAAAVSRSSRPGDNGLNAPTAADVETRATSLPVNSVAASAPTSKAPATVQAIAISKPETTPIKVAETHTTPRKAAEKTQQPSIAIPTVSNTILSGAEAVASRTANAPSRGLDSYAVQSAEPLTVKSGSLFADNQVETPQPQHARLIGDLPSPNVPYQLTNVEGEVRVRFTVDPDGRPVMSTFSVVSSSNPAFTDAVKRVIPPIRFEAARSGGPESRAISEIVQLGFKFSPRNR